MSAPSLFTRASLHHSEPALVFLLLHSLMSPLPTWARCSWRRAGTTHARYARHVATTACTRRFDTKIPLHMVDLLPQFSGSLPPWRSLFYLPATWLAAGVITDAELWRARLASQPTFIVLPR